MAQSPLILSVMTLAYQDMSVGELTAKPVSTLEERRRHLFDTYIERMFKRHGSRQQPYSNEQTKKWLAWLGQKLVQYKQNIFLIEGLQPIWLTDRNTRRIYILISRIVILMSYMVYSWFEGLFVGIGIGFLEIIQFERIEYATRNSDRQPENNSNARVKICARCGFKNHKNANQCANCLTNLQWAKVNLGKFKGTEDDTRRIGMEYRRLSGFPVPEDYMPSQAPVGPVQSKEGSKKMSFLTYLISFLALRLISFSLVRQTFPDSGDILFIAFSAFLLSGFFWAKTKQTDLSNEIQPVESIQWSWRQMLKSGCVLWIMSFLCTAVFWVLTPASTADVFNNFGTFGPVIFGMSITLLTLPFILPIALMGGLKTKKVEEKAFPNQGIWLSIKNTIIITVSFGVLTLLVVMLVRSLFPDYEIDLFPILLLFVLWQGGLAVIQHYTLRLIFWLNKCTPWDYTTFLDYATDRIFLRKVGGGYVFIHRLMMEHFAELGKAEEKT
jgi:hypothetical protein